MGSDDAWEDEGSTTVGFQSTLPVWGATFPRYGRGGRISISIHAPRVGSDLERALENLERRLISIHAPRVGSDSGRGTLTESQKNFNPRSPCGERRKALDRRRGASRFQSTLPVWGATRSPLVTRSSPFYFNPRSPCGERL